jgi:RimJ/RimL family protein N-acetyltransferase
LTLGVEVAETGELIGDVALFWPSRVRGGGEIGYVLHRIVARIDARNESSAKLALRLGMRQEARLVHNEFFKGEWSTELGFAMLADEWPAYRSA